MNFDENSVPQNSADLIGNENLSPPDLSELDVLEDIIYIDTGNSIEVIPEDPLDKALECNIRYQNHLFEAIQQQTLLLESDKTLYDDCMTRQLEEFQKNKGIYNPCSGYLKFFTRFAHPYFHHKGSFPAPSEDVLERRKVGVHSIYECGPKMWPPEELKDLETAVKDSMISKPLQELREEYSLLEDQISRMTTRKSQVIPIKERMATLKEEIKAIKKQRLEDLLMEHGDSLDWLKIAATHMKSARTAEQCEAMWKNYLQPSINKSKFSKEEDTMILKLLKKAQGKETDWEEIAEKLKMNRTALQCFERYKCHLSKYVNKKKWTPEEDQHLKQLVENFTVGETILWDKVCFHMEGRKRHQITNRWNRAISPRIKKDKWSVEEDAMLVACVKRFGMNHWQMTAQLLPGRPSHDCRERYTNTLFKELKIGNWSKSEDNKLRQLIRQHGYGKWSKISREMPGRNDNSCFTRAARLSLHKVLNRYNKSSDEEVTSTGRQRKRRKRIARSNVCFYQNDRMKTIQKQADEKLEEGLKKIGHEGLDLSNASLKFLRQLKDTLLQESTPCFSGLPKKIALKKVNTEKDRNIEDSSDTEEEVVYYDDSSDDSMDVESEEEECEDEEEEEEYEDIEKPSIGSRIKTEEEAHIDRVLFDLFLPRALIRNHPNIRPIAMSAKARVERSILKSYLFKRFDIKQEESKEMEIKMEEIDTIFDGVDLHESVPRFLHLFMLPPIKENQFQVLPPNKSALSTMRIMLLLRQDHIAMASYLRRSRTVLGFLGNHKNTAANFRCNACLYKNNKPIPEEKAEEVLERRKEILIADPNLKKGVEYEISDTVPEECYCHLSCKLKEQYDLLKKRFVCMFLWPGFLSCFQVNNEYMKKLNANSKTTQKRRVRNPKNLTGRSMLSKFLVRGPGRPRKLNKKLPKKSTHANKKRKMEPVSSSNNDKVGAIIQCQIREDSTDLPEMPMQIDLPQL